MICNTYFNASLQVFDNINESKVKSITVECYARCNNIEMNDNLWIVYVHALQSCWIIGSEDEKNLKSQHKQKQKGLRNNNWSV